VALTSAQDTPLLICFFCARFLSIAFFRVPGIRQQLLTALSIESRDGPALQRCGELGVDLSVFDERAPTREEVAPHPMLRTHFSQTARFPSIFQWHRYHTAMLAWRQDSEDERLRPLKDWPAVRDVTLPFVHAPTQALVVRESMFQAFLKEYIEVVQSKQSDSPLPWYERWRDVAFAETSLPLAGLRCQVTARW
jgi:hypothetical protein